MALRCCVSKARSTVGVSVFQRSSGVRTANVRWASSSSKDGLVVVTNENGVTTIRMNNPKRLNGWTQPMMNALQQAMEDAAVSPDSHVTVITGTDPYYCAGVNLADTIKPMHPKKLHKMIVQHNQSLFDRFLDFPKPIIAAVNGPAIGASVTSATLCDAIIASENATFNTPFARLGITPEGCSSVVFPQLMGEANAQRMLGEEGWVPTAAEAKEAGLIHDVVPHGDFTSRVQTFAEGWAREVEAGTRTRPIISEGRVAELKRVNAEESEALATAFLSAEFLDNQYKFLKSKGKDQAAMVFLVLKSLRPLWSMLL